MSFLFLFYEFFLLFTSFVALEYMTLGNTNTVFSSLRICFDNFDFRESEDFLTTWLHQDLDTVSFGSQLQGKIQVCAPACTTVWISEKEQENGEHFQASCIAMHVHTYGTLSLYFSSWKAYSCSDTP